MVSKLFVAGMVFAASPFIASAQTCLGQLSLAKVHVNGSANVLAVSQGHGLEARVSTGTSRVFATGGVGTMGYDYGETERSYIFGASAGVPVSLGTKNLQVCPVASYDAENGPNNVALKRSSRRAIFGLALGGTAPLSSAIGLSGYALGGYQSEKNLDHLVSSDRDNNYSSSGKTAQVGLGLQYRGQYSLRASFNMYVPKQPNFEAFGHFVVGFSYALSDVR